MHVAEQRVLQVLEAVTQNSRITQRLLSTKLGIALGLTNMYLRRLTRKGYIKCVNIRPNRLRYLITPHGIAEKARLTYEFMGYSLRLYRHVRSHLKTVLEQIPSSGASRIAIHGTAEAAELAYLSLKELGFEPVLVLNGGVQPQEEFLGMKVHGLDRALLSMFDRLIVATFEQPGRLVASFVQQGVGPDKLVPLRPLENDHPTEEG